MLGSRQKKRPNREGRARGTGSGALILHLRASQVGLVLDVVLRLRRRRRGRRRVPQKMLPPIRTAQVSQTGLWQIGQTRQGVRETPVLQTPQWSARPDMADSIGPGDRGSRCGLAIIRRPNGGVAQLVRASGSYPLCPGFKSLHRHHNRRSRLLEVWLRHGSRLGRMQPRPLASTFFAALSLPQREAPPPLGDSSRCDRKPLRDQALQIFRYRRLTLSQASRAATSEAPRREEPRGLRSASGTFR